MTVFAGHSYTYRADGLKTGETGFTLNANGSSDTVTLAWNYDGLDRLTSETSSDGGNTARNYTDNYTYDLNSNRVSETTDNTNGTDMITSNYPGAPRFRGLRDGAPDSFRHGAAPLNNVNDKLTQGVEGPDLLLDPGVLFTYMHFSYSFLPGTVNCFKWTLLAGVSGWIISKI